MLPVEHNDPVNAAILAISEDKIAGFHEDPFAEVARQSGQPLESVLTRIRAMLEAGTIRRVRQTLLANKLAEGALVAWKVPADKLTQPSISSSKRIPSAGTSSCAAPIAKSAAATSAFGPP